MATTPARPEPHHGIDPVRARRERVARWTRLANRVGYLCFAVSVVGFVVALATSFSSTMAAVVVAGLIVGTVLLAPAIVLGYAVKAAEREDRDRGL
jgi:hypothetical protein